MSGPRLSELRLWASHEESVLTVLRSALIQLQTYWPDDGEVKLNRELYACFLRVNVENNRSGGLFTNGVLISDSRNPPRSDTKGKPPEHKLPDLQVLYMDHQATDALESVRSFAIECKRLGLPPISDRSLSTQYVSNGVRRFIDGEWKYGNGVASGAMVGYVESGTPSDIVPKVNRALERLNAPALTLPGTSGEELTEMDHTLQRPFAISPFRLVHLWIDKS